MSAFKVILLGNSGVGKTSILARFDEDTFLERKLPTIGIDFMTKSIKLDLSSCLKMIFWDTCGQERFMSISRVYYRGCDVAIFVYDVTNPQSFRDLKVWMNDFEQYSGGKPVIKMLLGNKSEKDRSRMVEFETAQSFADQHGMTFVEVSSKFGTNIEQAFAILAEMLADKFPGKVQQTFSSLDERESLIPQQATHKFKDMLACCCIL